MFLRKLVTRDEHEKTMQRMDVHEEELQDLAERVRLLEIEAGTYDEEEEQASCLGVMSP